MPSSQPILHTALCHDEPSPFFSCQHAIHNGLGTRFAAWRRRKCIPTPAHAKHEGRVRALGRQTGRPIVRERMTIDEKLSRLEGGRAEGWIVDQFARCGGDLGQPGQAVAECGVGFGMLAQAGVIPPSVVAIAVRAVVLCDSACAESRWEARARARAIPGAP